MRAEKRTGFSEDILDARSNRIFPLSQVSPEDTKFELTCGCTKMALLYLYDRYPRERVEEFVYNTRMNIDYLFDFNNWISLDYYYRFVNGLVEFTGNPRSPFETGAYAVSRRCFGTLAVICASFGTVAGSYRSIVQNSQRWNKVADWSLKELGRNKFRLSTTLRPGYRQIKNNCLAIQGVLSVIPVISGLPPARIEETECGCDAGNTCTFEVTWEGVPKRQWGWRVAGACLAAGFLSMIFIGFNTTSWAIAVLLGLSGYLFGRRMDYQSRIIDISSQNQEQAVYLLESVNAIEKLNKELQEKVERRTVELKKTMEDLKQSQAKILVAEKQAVVGVLAAGMAHEFNNPLNAICISNQSLKEDIGDDSKLKPQVEIIERASGRCRRIVNDLLSYSREPRLQVGVHLDDIVESSIDLFLAEHPGGIEIKKMMARGLPVVQLDRLQIQQAILNLIKNASDAMNDHGLVEVSLHGDSKNIILAVKDHGPGMSESLRKKIFDPFFTTKQTGKGLGLSITYQLVTRNGGAIDVSSREGEGSTFTITFPVPESGSVN